MPLLYWKFSELNRRRHNQRAEFGVFISKAGVHERTRASPNLETPNELKGSHIKAKTASLLEQRGKLCLADILQRACSLEHSTA